MFFSLLFSFYFVHVVNSLSSQEDLLITKYSQIGCLKLKSDKQFIVNDIQENPLLPYQTFSSSHMTIELCFRLCRRWFILMFNNQTNCICLYTINKPYEFNQYLGKFQSIQDCTFNSIKVYSLTNDIYVLPTLSSSTGYDWSLDGCYYLHGIQVMNVNLGLNHADYIQAIDLCQKHCQNNRKINYFSFFLSRKKSCYCLPIKIFQKIKPTALRKPLIHCSFLPYICHGFSSVCEKYYTKTNVDTVIKIDVQRYCSSSLSSSSDSISFVFDRTFYMCFVSILLNNLENTFSTIYNEHKCVSLFIDTHEQWSYLMQSSWITQTITFIWIDRESRYVFDEIIKLDNQILSSNNLCIIINRTELNRTSYELIQCDDVQAPGNFLCAQKPLRSTISYEDEFKMTTNESYLLEDEILLCPSEFILFNKQCYYVDSSFIYDIPSGELLCHNKYSNSTLVKYDSHEWGNINATRFLGRTFTDMLIEFFYYLLENKLQFDSIDEPDKKHWLRLLFGDKYNPNECVLRYFARASGAFTIFYRCNNGGHPVCQCEPIRTTIPKVLPIYLTAGNQEHDLLEKKVEQTRASSKVQASLLNSTTMFTLSNETNVTLCDNNTQSFISDDNLNNNNNTIEISSVSYNNISKKIIRERTQTKHSKYHILTIVLLGPILALCVLCIAIGFLIYNLHQRHNSYTPRSDAVGSNRRTKRSSTIVTMSDMPSTSGGALYSRLKHVGLAFGDIDTYISIDNSGSIDDNFELLPTTHVQIINHENNIQEADEDELYTTLQ